MNEHRHVKGKKHLLKAAIQVKARMYNTIYTCMNKANSHFHAPQNR